jgi:hypothetical protein
MGSEAITKTGQGSTIRRGGELEEVEATKWFVVPVVYSGIKLVVISLLL